MTPLPRVYMLPAEATLTRPQVREILASGHSRVPVYAGGDRRAIVGAILVKELLQYRLGATGGGAAAEGAAASAAGKGSHGTSATAPTARNAASQKPAKAVTSARCVFCSGIACSPCLILRPK